MRAPSRLRDPSARTRLVVAVLVGAACGGSVATAADWQDAILAGWMCGAAVHLVWMWATIWPMPAGATRVHARREDAGQATVDLAVLTAAVASLVAVGLFLLGGGSGGGQKVLQAVLTVLSVALAWGTVHTLFTARYARLYYLGSARSIDFNEPDDPRYRDFAYLAFTVGMTFQVSDTDIRSKEVRAVVLRHMLLSYLLGAVVIGVTVNLVAGLAQ